MKYTAEWAAKINLVTMRPNQDFGEGSFCIGDAGKEYLIYVEGSKADLDSTNFGGNFSVAWIHLTEGVIIPDKKDGRRKNTNFFRNPLTAEAILHLKLIDQSK